MHQHRYLAGELTSPATVPTGTALGRVVSMLGDNPKITVRTISQKMGVSVGTAHTLKRQASLFIVQSDLNMNKSEETGEAARPSTISCEVPP